MEDVLRRIGTCHQQSFGRDAVHIALASVRAYEDLNPGDRLCFAVKGDDKWVKKDTGDWEKDGNALGIADPFITQPINKGSWFYIFLFPGSIKSLKHEWTHEDFSIQTAKTESEKWMISYAAELGMTMDRLIEAGESFLDSGEYLSDGGRYEGMSIPEEFWDHFQNITGRGVPQDRRDSFFSCSC